MTAQPIGRNQSRDYAADMNGYIEENLPDGDVVLSAHTEKLVRKLLQRDPDLLYGWLLNNAAILLADYMRTRLRQQRNPRRSIAQAFKSGDADAVRPSPFETERYVVDSNNTWRLLGDMTGRDHRFVAENYETQSRELALRAAFHKAVARRVGAKTTAEVLTADSYEAIWRKLVGD